jgi:hypothetical protein
MSCCSLRGMFRHSFTAFLKAGKLITSRVFRHPGPYCDSELNSKYSHNNYVITAEKLVPE